MIADNNAPQEVLSVVKRFQDAGVRGDAVRYSIQTRLTFIRAHHIDSLGEIGL
jgi:hypothetical protein